MRILAAVTSAALTLAGCTTTPTAVDGSPPIRHVAVSRLPEQPAHDHEALVAQPPHPDDRSDPVAVAVALIVIGLEEQGLEVVDVGSDTVAVTPALATVQVAATHRADVAGAPHTSVYEIDLARDAEGSWYLVDFRQAQ